MDMMYVGMHGEGFGSWPGMTDGEYQTHMSLWCLLASPLILSKDLTNVPDVTKKTLLHEEIIEVNQDVMGKQAKKISDNGNLEIFTRTLSDSSRVVGFLNRGTTKASMTIHGHYLLRNSQKPCHYWG
jgi:alpha-galactosidase